MDKETHLANLIQLAWVDGKVTPHEMIFVQSLALRMGIDGATFQRIAKYPELIPSRLPASEADRQRQLCELIALAHIDMHKDTEELKLIHRVGLRLNFSAKQVENVVKYLENNTMPQNPKSLFE